MSRPRAFSDEVILDRASEVFWRQGFAATSVRDLTKATGLSVAALYHRFIDKNGLFVEVLKRYADRGLSDRLTRLGAMASPLEAIDSFFNELINISANDHDRRGCLLVNTATDGGQMPKAARDLVRERLGEVETFFLHQLRRAQSARLISAQINVAAMAETLLATVLAIRVLARLDPNRAKLRRLVAQATAPLASKGKSTKVKKP